MTRMTGKRALLVSAGVFFLVMKLGSAIESLSGGDKTG